MPSLRYDYTPGAIAAFWSKDARERIARAETAAIAEATDLAKKAARASVAAGGFSGKWQNAIRSKLYPSSGVSFNPAGFIYDKIDYARVFEEGATIAGKPILWLPIEANLPTGRGGRSWSPQRYSAEVGPLISVNVPGHPPLLFGLIKVSKRGKVLAGRRQRDLGVASGGITVSKPLFVGVPSVTDPKKFDIIAAIKAVAAQLPELYRKHLGDS